MALCGLQAARRQLTVEAGRSTDDDLMTTLLFDATDIITNYCGQPFEEHLDQFGFNGEIGSQNPTLELEERPLVSVNTLINGDGSTVNPSVYELLPKGTVYPKKRIRLMAGNAWLAPYTNPANSPFYNAPYGYLVNRNYAEDAILVTGLWAFNRKGPAAWVDSGLTLNGNTLAGALQIVVSAAPAFVFDVGALLRIDSEYFAVTGPYASSSQTSGFQATTLTVIPAYNGTTAAAHTTATKIYYYVPEPTVTRAAAIATAWLYEGRLNPSGPQMASSGLGTVDVSLRLSPRATMRSRISLTIVS